MNEDSIIDVYRAADGIPGEDGRWEYRYIIDPTDGAECALRISGRMERLVAVFSKIKLTAENPYLYAMPDVFMPQD